MIVRIGTYTRTYYIYIHTLRMRVPARDASIPRETQLVTVVARLSCDRVTLSAVVRMRVHVQALCIYQSVYLTKSRMYSTVFPHVTSYLYRRH